MSLPIGTVLFSTNIDPKQNVTPGIFNHVGIIVDDDQNIVEAQLDEGVILTSWADYKDRPYNWNNWGVLYPRNKEIGIKAAEAAKTYVGRKYAKLSSIRGLKRRMNCVSVVSNAYSEATDTEVKAAVPDDFIKYVNLFTDKISEIS